MLIATGVIVSAAAGFFLLPRGSARKLDKSGYPLTADVYRKKAERCRRAAAAELVNPK